MACWLESGFVGPAWHRFRRRLAGVLLTLLLVTPWEGQAQTSPGRVALIIANGDYLSSVDRITGPARDAEIMAKALRNLGFAVTLERNANARQLRSAVDAFANDLKRAGKGAVGFFYFAGHGGSDAAGTQNYLLPVDVADVESADYAKVGYSVNALIQRLEYVDDPLALAVVIDACRNSRTGSKARLTRPIEPPRGFLLAHSTSQGSLASDSGVYAEALAKTLGSSGATLDVAFLQVRDLVQQRSTQRPLFVSNLSEKDICLAGCNAGQSAKGKFGGNPQLLQATQRDAARLVGELTAIRAAERCARGHATVVELDASAHEALKRGDHEAAGGTWEQVIQRAMMISSELGPVPTADPRTKQIEDMLASARMVSQQVAQEDFNQQLRDFDRNQLPRAERSAKSDKHRADLRRMTAMRAEAAQLASAGQLQDATDKLADAANIGVDIEEEVTGTRQPRQSTSVRAAPQIPDLSKLLAMASASRPRMPGSLCD